MLVLSREQLINLTEIKDDITANNDVVTAEHCIRFQRVLNRGILYRRPHYTVEVDIVTALLKITAGQDVITRPEQFPLVGHFKPSSTTMEKALDRYRTFIEGHTGKSIDTLIGAQPAKSAPDKLPDISQWLTFNTVQQFHSVMGGLYVLNAIRRGTYVKEDVMPEQP